MTEEQQSQVQKPKKSIWKKWWFWAIIILIIIVWIINSTSERVEQVRDDIEQSVEKETTTQQEKVESATQGQINALRAAKNYLRTVPLSYSGLIQQLEFEGYSEQEAKYGADHCGADWNEQAAKAAKNYLNIMSFSRSGLIQQLEFEGYTSDQAEYGVKAVGY